MLKNLYIVTENNKPDLDNLYNRLKDIEVKTQYVIDPEAIDEDMLLETSLVITDSESYLESFRNARGNVAFLSGDGEIPWGVDYVFYGINNIDEALILDAYATITHESREILKTERILIRESKVEDVDIFYRIYSDPGITDYTEKLFDDIEDEKRYMQKYIREIYGFYGFGIWTLVLRQTGEIIGRAGITMRDGYDIPEIGYIIGKKFQKKGIIVGGWTIRNKSDYEKSKRLCEFSVGENMEEYI